MKSYMYAGLAMRLLVTAVSPASGTPALNVDTQHPSVESMRVASSIHPWTSGNETSTLPWAAPRGHHQPGVSDIPSRPDLNNLSDEDARIDRIVRSVCRNC